MRIVFLTNEYSHEKLPAPGGLGTFLKVIAAELTQKGHEIYILGFGKRDKDFDDNGVRVIFRKGYLKKYRLAELVRSVAASLGMASLEKRMMAAERKYMAAEVGRFAAQNNVDIVESPAFNGVSAYWNSKIPLVVRFHGSRGFWHKYLGKKAEPIRTWFEHKALSEADSIIAVSNFAADAIREIYGISREIKVIYNGIDSALFSPKLEPVIPGSIFYVGTLSDAKGVDMLCRAFNIIIRQNPDVSLHLVGRGEEYYNEKVKQILEPAALARTTYYGGLQLAEIPTVLSRADVCVYPSLNETFGLVYVEAMAMEKVVIAAENRVSPEIIGTADCGFLARDAQEIATIALKVINDRDMARAIGTNARQRVLSHFTKEAMAEATIAHYEEVLGK